MAGKVNPPKYAVCVVLATTKLDVDKKVCELLEFKRASFDRMDDISCITGIEFGGVTAFGLPNNLAIYVDAEEIVNHELNMVGSNCSSKLALDPRELQKFPSVKVIDGLAHNK